jgi:hypothetical protein
MHKGVNEREKPTGSESRFIKCICRLSCGVPTGDHGNEWNIDEHVKSPFFTAKAQWAVNFYEFIGFMGR